MKNEFNLAFNEVLEEKQLPKEVILAAIESAMASAYRRAVNASTAQQVEAKLDPETGKVNIFAEKEVVEDIQDERTEVILEKARQINAEAQVGDMVMVECTPGNFGRVAAQTARQVIQQRIREAERQVQLEYFVKQTGEIISGIVQAINNQGVTIGLDMKAEGIMPANQKILSERFKIHDRVRALVLEAKESPRGPQIILSRAHRDFLRRLLENEVPEIYHGIVEIRAIAREPGQRAKVAVSATQPNVDPVGACVGIRGVRIQAIVKELHDEKIDIIAWNPDPVIYISKAISPARVSGVYLLEGSKTATVVVPEDQLSLAIGRDGQNARLAAKLTGWRIDIKSLTEAASDALVKLQSEPALAELAASATQSIPQVEEILAKKADGRPVTPEEYSALTQFMDRVERRTMERQEEAVKKEEERTAAARAELPAAAFETPLENLGLPEHVFNILTEAEYHTIGAMMLAMELNPDRVLGLAGIGPKAMQSITNALAAVSFPEPEKPAEPAAEAVAEEIAPVEAEAAPAEAEAAPVPAEAPEVVEAAAPAGEAVEELEKVFSLENIVVKAPSTEEEEETGEKKPKKKGKKSREIVFDETRGEAVARKKHKRGDVDWEEPV